MIGRVSFAGLLLLAAAPGCLPKQSLARRDEIEADLYTLALDVDVVTEGLDVAPFRWHLDGTVAWSYTRTFRDGSMGHMVRFPELRGRLERDGQVVEVPVPLKDALLEVRAFPDGEVLKVSGASRWSGEAGHLEVLDVLWPALSPHLPSTRAEAGEFTTSWPAWVEGGPKVRERLKARWTPGPRAFDYEGTLEGQGGYVEATGTAKGTVEQGSGDLRLAAHSFAWTRTTRTRWPTGADVRQTFTYTGSLRHTGTEPAPPLDLPVASDDPVADALPLKLRDGRTVEDPASDISSSVPFLLLPDDVSGSDRAALRALVTGTW